MKSRVLIVDDNEDVLTTYRIVLERMGYEVIEALNGRECLARIEKNPPDRAGRLLMERFGRARERRCPLPRIRHFTRDHLPRHLEPGCLEVPG